MRVPHPSRCGEGWVCSSEQPHRDFVAFAVVAPAAKSTHWHPGAQRGICILFCRSAESHSPRRSLPAARRESSRGRRLCSAEYRAFCGTLRLLTPVFAVAFVAPAFRPAAFRLGLPEVPCRFGVPQFDPTVRGTGSQPVCLRLCPFKLQLLDIPSPLSHDDATKTGVNLCSSGFRT